MKKDKILIKNFIWNTIGIMLNSFNSLFFLIVVSRINGLNDAGIFSLAFSTALLLYTIGLYSGRMFQVTDIENTSGNESRHIVIKAQSKYYDELGYFKAKLKEDGILNNIVSTQGEKQDDFVKIVIEGDLPWEKY